MSRISDLLGAFTKHNPKHVGLSYLSKLLSGKFDTTNSKTEENYMKIIFKGSKINTSF